MTIQFWSNDPSILLNNEYIFELLPSSSMSFNAKLNAMSRLILLLTLLGFILTSSKRIIVVGILTLIGIFVFYNIKNKNEPEEEGFELNDLKLKNEDKTDPSINKILARDFQEGTSKNPFSNVLLTQIEDTPERKSAPPAFSNSVDKDITKYVKETVQMLNPTIKNTNKQLFGDLWQDFQLSTFLRAFYSTPNSRVANDQGAYAQYLYNDLKYSGKESTPEGAIARVKDNWRWIDG